jgi:hypothetical protein
MSTGYLVKCPRVSCRWFGELPAHPDPEAWREPTANVAVVVFECPRCQREWRARLTGNDVEALPLQDDDFEPALWPVDLGTGD